MNYLFSIGGFLLGYLFGSIPCGLWLVQAFHGIDIRNYGSGNIGTTNVFRTVGPKTAAAVLTGDMLKGILALYIMSKFMADPSVMAITALGALLGHNYSLFLGFKGGKGIASTIGVFMVCESVHGIGWAMVAIMALVAAAVFIYITEFGAMGSFIAITPPAISGCIRLFLDYGRRGMGSFNAGTLAFHIVSNMLIFAICFFTWFAHRKNIERMLAGDEHPTSFKKMLVKAKAKKMQERKDNESSSKDKS